MEIAQASESSTGLMLPKAIPKIPTGTIHQALRDHYAKECRPIVRKTT
jgi:hypothetical protein